MAWKSIYDQNSGTRWNTQTDFVTIFQIICIMKASEILKDLNCRHIPTPIRTPAHAFNDEESINNEPVSHYKYLLNNLDIGNGSYVRNGWCWTIKTEHLLDSRSRYDLPADTGSINYDIRYEVSQWTGSLKRPHGKGYRWFIDGLNHMLSELWKCDALPFIRIVTDYIHHDTWTHYLKLADEWMKQGGSIKLLDLVLQYDLGMEKLKLMKSAPYTILETDGWELDTVILVNELPLEVDRFTKEEPFPRFRCVFSLISIESYMRRTNSDLIAKLPKVLVGGTIAMNSCFLPTDRFSRANTNEVLVYTGGLVSTGGVMGFLDQATQTIKYNQYTERGTMPLEQYYNCQFCSNDCAVCSGCKYIDPLFCGEHTSLLSMFRSALLCDTCRGNYLETMCNTCFQFPISRCGRCKIPNNYRLCSSCTHYHRVNSSDESDKMSVCSKCYHNLQCYGCDNYFLDVSRCEKCNKKFCPMCNPVTSIDISPSVLFPNTIQNMIVKFMRLCRVCMDGKTVNEIQDEKRNLYYIFPGTGI